MARMHSRKKGKSGSKNLIKRKNKLWNIHSKQEVEQLAIKLAKTGKKEALIGIILRDSYGIPDVKTITGKKIGQILVENKLQGKIPTDLQFLILKDINLVKHFGVHKKDMSVKRGLQLTISKINRLAKYYVGKGKLPADWKYDRSKAKLLVE
mgnify:CR=1 FL=1